MDASLLIVLVMPDLHARSALASACASMDGPVRCVERATVVDALCAGGAEGADVIAVAWSLLRDGPGGWVTALRRLAPAGQFLLLDGQDDLGKVGRALQRARSTRGGGS